MAFQLHVISIPPSRMKEKRLRYRCKHSMRRMKKNFITFECACCTLCAVGPFLDKLLLLRIIARVAVHSRPHPHVYVLVAPFVYKQCRHVHSMLHYALSILINHAPPPCTLTLASHSTHTSSLSHSLTAIATLPFHTRWLATLFIDAIYFTGQ